MAFILVLQVFYQHLTQCATFLFYLFNAALI